MEVNLPDRSNLPRTFCRALNKQQDSSVLALSLDLLCLFLAFASSLRLRISLICLRIPTSKSSTLWSMAADTSIYLQSYVLAADLPSTKDKKCMCYDNISKDKIYVNTVTFNKGYMLLSFNNQRKTVILYVTAKKEMETSYKRVFTCICGTDERICFKLFT